MINRMRNNMMIEFFVPMNFLESLMHLTYAAEFLPEAGKRTIIRMSHAIIASHAYLQMTMQRCANLGNGTVAVFCPPPSWSPT